MNTHTPFNRNSPHRKSIRLKGYDYSSEGGYFVTVCTHGHEMLFGNIVNNEVRLSEIGEIATQCWNETPNHFPNVLLDEYIVMPNHVHGIIIINNDHRRDVQLNVPTENIQSRISPRRGTLSVIIRTYKAAVTTKCRRNGHDEFRWQSRFYEHIIRNERNLQNIQRYIVNNPSQWNADKENLRGYNIKR